MLQLHLLIHINVDHHIKPKKSLCTALLPDTVAATLHSNPPTPRTLFSPMSSSNLSSPLFFDGCAFPFPLGVFVVRRCCHHHHPSPPSTNREEQEDLQKLQLREIHRHRRRRRRPVSLSKLSVKNDASAAKKIEKFDAFCAPDDDLGFCTTIFSCWLLHSGMLAPLVRH